MAEALGSPGPLARRVDRRRAAGQVEYRGGRAAAFDRDLFDDGPAAERPARAREVAGRLARREHVPVAVTCVQERLRECGFRAREAFLHFWRRLRRAGAEYQQRAARHRSSEIASPGSNYVWHFRPSLSSVTERDDVRKSATGLSRGDPWLCVPVSRRVCPERHLLSCEADRTGRAGA